MFQNTLNKLDSMFQNQTWELNLSKRGGGIKNYQVFAANKITANITETKHLKNRGKNIFNSITIKLGAKVLEALEWNISDKILIFINPDDQLIFKCIKHEKGYHRLLIAPRAKLVQFNFTYNGKAILEKTPTFNPNFSVQNGQLIFELRKPE